MHNFRSAIQLVHFVELQKSGNLDEPAHIVRVDVVVERPFGQLFPLVGAFSINGQTKLRVLVFALLQISSHLLKKTNGFKIKRGSCISCS
jgi:hypothetical protein